MTVLMIIPVLTILDTCAGFIIPRLTDQTPIILSGNGSQGVIALWKLSRTVPSVVVFTGSSQLQTAASPEIFDQQVKALSNQTAYSANVSVFGAVTPMSRDILRNLLIPHGVKTVFYGVEARAFHVNRSPEQWESAYYESPLGYALSLPSGLEQWFLLWLLEHSTFVQYRGNLRRWLVGELGEIDALAKVDQSGYWIMVGNHGRDRSVIDQQFLPFEIDDHYYKAFQDILETCHQPELHCFILNMPMHADAYQYFPAQDEKRYKDMLYDTVRGAGLNLWDFDTPECFNYFGDEGFANLNHLNTDGGAKFTRQLALIYLNKLSADSSCPKVVTP